MKKIFLSAAMVAVMCSVYGQKTATPQAQWVDKTTLDLATGHKGTATIPTLLMPVSIDSCGLIYAEKSINSGYITGNNGYGDKEKTMSYSLSYYGVSTPATVDSVFAIFKSKMGLGNGQVRAKVYSKTPTGIGALLGTSQVITVSAIDTAEGWVKFPFTNPVNVSNDFIVSIDFSHLYTTGDSLGLAMTSISGNGCSFVDPTQAGEIWNDDSYILVSDPDSWGVKFDMAIFPKMSVTMGMSERSAAQMNFKVYPQPAKDGLSIDFVGQKKGMACLKIIDITGRVVWQHQQLVAQGTAYSVRVNTTALPAGMYVAQLNNEELNATIKVVIQ